jgi:NAD(P)-dependent dehydrogenase (short-subunit alcohol dehydrogenase family)
MGALEGKVAVVTGAGRGIGRGEALLLAAEGAAVVVNDLDPGPVEQVTREIEERGGKAIVQLADVADWNQAQALIASAVDTFGDLHILVNNAGFLRDKMSFNMDEESFDAVIRVHLKGHFAPSRWAAAYWRDKAKGGQETAGRIINTSSEAGLWGNPGQSNYGAAKGGVYAMTLVLARELRRYGVTANAIAPRARTRMTEPLGGSFDPSQRPTDAFDTLDPDNVAPVVGWLASDAAAEVSGQVFLVTGGRVHLISAFEEASVIRKDQRWTVDELMAAQAELFARRPSTIPPFSVAE